MFWTLWNVNFQIYSNLIGTRLFEMFSFFFVLFNTYFFVDQTIAYDSGELVPPKSNDLFHARKIVRVALEESSGNSRQVSHVKDVVEFIRRW